MYLHDKKISVVVSDFDGTIIKPGMLAPKERFFKNVERLIECGIPFVAASGRQYANLRRILSPIADKIDFIAENGCLVAHQGEIIYKSVIPWDVEKELLKDLMSHEEGHIAVSGADTLYICNKSEWFVDLMKNKVKNNVTVVDSFDEIHDEIIKTSILFPAGNASGNTTGIPKEPEAWFHKKYDSLLAVANGGNGWLDFNPLGSSKGTALRVLADCIGVPTSEMIAFGDNENDIAMLKEVGISYAVDTALPHVKEVCDYICADVDDVLEEMLENCR